MAHATRARAEDNPLRLNRLATLGAGGCAHSGSWESVPIRTRARPSRTGQQRAPRKARGFVEVLEEKG